MRILIWILLLLGLAFAVSRYHDSVMSDARDERTSRQREFRDTEGLPDGFGHAIVGQASGAEPLESPATTPQPEPRRITTRTPPSPTPPPSPSGSGSAAPSANRVATHVVKAGESLSKICAAHYGSGRPDVVAAVVKYNRLASGDAIREGQTLELPPLSALGLPAR